MKNMMSEAIDSLKSMKLTKKSDCKTEFYCSKDATPFCITKSGDITVNGIELLIIMAVAAVMYGGMKVTKKLMKNC